MNDEYLLPVELCEYHELDPDAIYRGHKFNVIKSDLVTAESLREEGAEEYREAIDFVIKELESNEILRAFGTREFREIRNLPALELIEKVKSLRAVPKPGEIWVDVHGVKVIIRNATYNNVCYAWWSGSFLSFSAAETGCFKNRFTKTADRSKNYEALIEELKSSEKDGEAE